MENPPEFVLRMRIVRAGLRGRSPHCGSTEDDLKGWAQEVVENIGQFLPLLRRPDDSRNPFDVGGGQGAVSVSRVQRLQFQRLRGPAPEFPDHYLAVGGF